MEESVLVVVAQWCRDELNAWNLVMDNNHMSRTVEVFEGMKYSQLVDVVEAEFGLKFEKLKVQTISYMFPMVGSTSSVGQCPPVCIDTDMGLKNFLSMRRVSVGLNFFVSFEIDRKGPGCTQELNSADNIVVDVMGRKRIQVDDRLIPDDVLVAHAEAVEAQLVESKKGDGVYVQCSAGTSCSLSEDSETESDEDEANESQTEKTNIVDGVYQECSTGTSCSLSEDNETESAEYEANVGENDGFESDGFEMCSDSGEEHNHDVEERAQPEYSEDDYPEDYDVGEGGHIFADALTRMFDAQSSRSRGRNIDRQNEHSGQDEISGAEVESSDVASIFSWNQVIMIRFNCRSCLAWSIVIHFNVFSPVIVQERSNDVQETRSDVHQTSNVLPRTNNDVPETSNVVHETSNVASEPCSDIDLDEVTKIHDDVRGFDDSVFVDSPPVFRTTCRLVRPCSGGKLDIHNAQNEIFIGREFENKKAFQAAMAVYAMKGLFHFRYPKSDKRRVIARCYDRKCPWRVYGVFLNKTQILQIRKFNPKHTCTVASKGKYSKGAKTLVVAEYLKGKFAHGKVGPRPVEIPAMVLTDLHVKISYSKAWHAREIAMQKVRGTEAGSFKLLRTYLYLLKKTNPGTVYNLEKAYTKTGEERFKYVFFALGASIAGMHHMRRVIIIDGTQVKAKFKGVMMTASCQDANFQVFPIGFGVVDAENHAAWTWFLT